MASHPLTYAFIDSQNVNLGIQRLGWKLDLRKFRVFLEQKYAVQRAYFFIGYLEQYADFYEAIRSYGYTPVFKEVVHQEGKPKGNVDAELVLQAMLDYPVYDRAVIVTSDGDFACLVHHLAANGKLERVLSPSTPALCSALLKRAAGHRIDFLDSQRRKLEYRWATK